MLLVDLFSAAFLGFIRVFYGNSKKTGGLPLVFGNLFIGGIFPLGTEGAEFFKFSFSLYSGPMGCVQLKRGSLKGGSRIFANILEPPFNEPLFNCTHPIGPEYNENENLKNSAPSVPRGKIPPIKRLPKTRGRPPVFFELP